MITVGGVTASLEETAQVLDSLYDAPGNHMRRYLVGTALEGMDYHKVSAEELYLFPELALPKGTKQHHVAHVRPACIHALQRLLAEAGWHVEIAPLPKLPVHSAPNGSSGFDPISSRRTAKRYYGEAKAETWAKKEFPGALVQKVGDWVPKQGYDVRATLADGFEIHIEAKYSESGSTVMLSEGERSHVQESECIYEHVLYVVTGAQVININEKWHCSGGSEVAYRNWKIGSDELKLIPSWRYNVPSH